MTELLLKKDKTGNNFLEYALLPFVYDITSNWYTEKYISTDVLKEDYLDCHGKYLICCFIGIKRG